MELSRCGESLTFYNLKGICQFHSPELLFLIKTKNKNHFVKRILQKCGYSDFAFVEPRSLAGGLSLAWYADYDISILYEGDFFFHGCINAPAFNEKWDILFCYTSSVDDSRLT